MVSEDNERILEEGRKMKKAILYINQFFGQIGGEDKADFKPEIREGKVGPALEYAKTLDDHLRRQLYGKQYRRSGKGHP